MKEIVKIIDLDDYYWVFTKFLNFKYKKQWYL